jgi:hypothetical protein
MLTCSASGADTLPQLVRGKSENLHCFKNIRKLLTISVANRKAGVIHAILNNYLMA